MKKLKLFQVDAFTSNVFGGNPAAVIPLEDKFLPDDLMQKIALENNLSETAFIVNTGENRFDIRWFTPVSEIPQCGHATLGSAYVIFNHLGFEKQFKEVILTSKLSGKLTVKLDKSKNLLTMDFPTQTMTDKIEIKDVKLLEEAFTLKQYKQYKIVLGTYYFAIELPSIKDIKESKPDFEIIKKTNRGVVITSVGDEKVDFVSRFFHPVLGINEDPVTGSSHTLLSRYWNKKTGKTLFSAEQLSKRGGKLVVEYCGERTKMSGNCVDYLIGEIFLPQ